MLSSDVAGTQDTERGMMLFLFENVRFHFQAGILSGCDCAGIQETDLGVVHFLFKNVPLQFHDGIL